MSKPWWQDNQYYVMDLENEEWGTKNLMGRETPDGWEYAVVGWRYQRPTLYFMFKNGKVREENTDV